MHRLLLEQPERFSIAIVPQQLGLDTQSGPGRAVGEEVSNGA